MLKTEPTREEMVKILVAEVDNWDTDNLISWVKEELKYKLEESTDDEVYKEYKLQIEGIIV